MTDYNYSIIPNTGITKEDLGNEEFLKGAVLPQGKYGSLSMGGWTESTRGFWQQTFLGASIKDFNLSAGFGDTSSTLSVNLIVDEYNKSDGLFLGSGDDVYHNGKKDTFQPPVVGAPVFFKFGRNPSDIEQSWRKTLDDTYGFYTFDNFEYDTDELVPPIDATYPSGDNSEYGDAVYGINFPDKEYAYYSGAIPDDDEENLAGYKNVFVDRTPDFTYDSRSRGKNHFVFGGILQAYTEQKGQGGNPSYNAKLIDPREILSNAIVLLNNYQGTTYNYKNLINVYGFLEYDPTDELEGWLKSTFDSKQVLEKKVNSKGEISYTGADIWKKQSLFFPTNFLPIGSPPRPTSSFYPTFAEAQFLPNDVSFTNSDYGQKVASLGLMPSDFPITGQGFSRRSGNGIPWYRVSQALASLFEYYGFLPKEYKYAGFGGLIDFRGYKYVVDFTGLPLNLIPPMYYLDFDQIDLLSLAQEICDITSHELFVSLLPVIDHPACSKYYWRNRWEVEVKGREENQIAGIIRLDAINKTKQPRYGAITDYIKSLESDNIYVDQSDVGFEVSNVTTDKFVVGAQEVEMYYFSNNKDRDELQLRRRKDGLANNFDNLQSTQWDLETSLSQQIIPFYGFLGEKSVTIPKGFGAYKQILLDAHGLDAHGVGNYYVTTEMELRHAAVSYEQWRDFLLKYDEVYIQNVSENQQFWRSFSNSESLSEKFADITENVPEQLEDIINKVNELANQEYAVSVPRCVWDSDKNWMGEDGFPASPCSPPYGYPLYYKRAEKIGIPEAGIVAIGQAIGSVISNYSNLKKLKDERESYFLDNKDEAMSRLFQLRQNLSRAYGFNGADFQNKEEYILNVASQIDELERQYTEEAQELSKLGENFLSVLKSPDGTALTKSVPQTARKHLKNAKKVYNFVKRVADEFLGRKFLVKIPKACNINYNKNIYYYPDFSQNISNGPFGFKPLPLDPDPTYLNSVYPDLEYETLRGAFPITSETVFEHYLDYVKLKQTYPTVNPRSLTYYESKKAYTYGALKVNWNPVNESWDFNYKPEPQGGFFNFALHDRNMTFSEQRFLPKDKMTNVVRQGLAPIDLTNLLIGGNRVSPYVRFDNSELYDFSKIPSDSISQQARDRDGFFIPDVSETLENLEPDNKDFLNESFNDVNSTRSTNRRLQRKRESVAFVKCTVDEELYMTPPVVETPTHIWANDVDVGLALQPPTVVQIRDENGCLSSSSVPTNPIPIFKVPSSGLTGQESAWLLSTSNLTDENQSTISTPVFLGQMRDGGTISQIINNPSLVAGIGFADVIISSVTGVTLNSGVPFTNEKAAGFPSKITSILSWGRRWDEYTSSWDVITEDKYLDSDNVYAVLTLPDKVIPIAEKRYCDSVISNYQNASLKNILTQDVIRINDFNEPAPKINKIDDDDTSCRSAPLRDLTYKEVSRAKQAHESLIRGKSLELGKIDFTSPSPVYPDLAVLPLLSWERCYGPWQSISAINVEEDPRTRYYDIGGKIEFVKDENLAPWNFAGYQLMNEAGSLKAQLSNSLLLLSERGGFSYQDYPSGISLAKRLLEQGPLVTSVTVDVGTAGIKTTVKMDLYTSKFGKLQKQKEMAISQVARERQRIIDQNNAAIRRGLGKGQANMDLYGGVLKNGGANLLRAAQFDPNEYTKLQKREFKENVQVIKNRIDEATGQFVTENVGLDREAIDELQEIYPDNKDLGRIQNNYAAIDKLDQFISQSPIGNSWDRFKDGLADKPREYVSNIIDQAARGNFLFNGEIQDNEDGE